MSICQYCNTNAGFFRHEHPECAERAETGLQELRERIEKAIRENEDASIVIPRLTALVEQYRLPAGAKEAAIYSLEKATAEKAKKYSLSPDEFDNIYAFYCHYNYDFGDRANVVEKKRFGFSYAGLSNLLWHVKQGSPLPYDSVGRAHFNMSADEQPIYCFGSTILAEEKTVTSRGYAGISVPIGEGIRVNTGSLGGRSVTGLAPIDEGDFLMTNQSIYFGGQHKTLHIPYRAILRFKPYTDGVGIFQNSGTQKVFIQEFHGGESGWFINEMIQTLMEGRLK